MWKTHSRLLLGILKIDIESIFLPRSKSRWAQKSRIIDSFGWNCWVLFCRHAWTPTFDAIVILKILYPRSGFIVKLLSVHAYQGDQGPKGTFGWDAGVEISIIRIFDIPIIPIKCVREMTIFTWLNLLIHVVKIIFI